MINISIEPTSFCNAKCSVCRRFVDPNAKKFINKELDINILLAFLERQSNFTLTLTGLLGEPLIYSKINILLKYIIDKKIHTRIHTNFNIKNIEILDNLKIMLENNLLDIWIAIDSFDQKINNMYRATNIKQVLKNIDYLKYKGNKLKIRTILFEHNWGSLGEIEKYTLDNQYVWVPTESHTYTKELKRPKNIYNIYNIKSAKKENKCIKDLAITADGVVSPCCYSAASSFSSEKSSPGEYIILLKNLKKLHISNIGDIREIYKNEFIQLFENKTSIVCKKCKYNTQTGYPI